MNLLSYWKQTSHQRILRILLSSSSRLARSAKRNFEKGLLICSSYRYSGMQNFSMKVMRPPRIAVSVYSFGNFPSPISASILSSLQNYS